MKKKLKLLCMFLAVTLILTSLTAVPASAAEDTEGFLSATEDTMITLYPAKDAKAKELYFLAGIFTIKKNQGLKMFSVEPIRDDDGYLCRNVNIYSVTSSNSSVLSIKKSENFVYPDGGELILVYYKAKKTGKTTITVTAGQTEGGAETETAEVRVVKYKNPLKSLKLGNKTISGEKFSKSSVLRLKYKDYANKKISLKSLKLKKNWRLDDVYLMAPSGKGYVGKGSFSFDEDGNLRSSYGAKLTKKGSFLSISVTNTKTGQSEQLTILFS